MIENNPLNINSNDPTGYSKFKIFISLNLQTHNFERKNQLEEVDNPSKWDLPFLLKEKSFFVKKKKEFDNYGIFKNMKKILLEDVSVKKKSQTD